MAFAGHENYICEIVKIAYSQQLIEPLENFALYSMFVSLLYIINIITWLVSWAVNCATLALVDTSLKIESVWPPVKLAMLVRTFKVT